jgi:hypothetical protein
MVSKYNTEITKPSLIHFNTFREANAIFLKRSSFFQVFFLQFVIIINKN